MMEANEIVGRFLQDGWAGIDNAGERANDARMQATSAQREEYMRRARVIEKALGDDDGKAALAVLVEMTMIRPPSEEEVAARTAEHFAILKAMRDGQANIVFMIFEMLRVARGADPQSGG